MDATGDLTIRRPSATSQIRWFPTMPFDTRSIFIGIAELAKDERGAAIQFPPLRNDKLAHRRLEAVVEGRADGNRAVGPEVVQPSKEVLAIDGEPAPFHAGVGGQHAVGDISHGSTQGLTLP